MDRDTGWGFKGDIGWGAAPGTGRRSDSGWGLTSR
jgi:hypothetical protein